MYDDGSGKEKKDGVKARPAQKRYVPLVKEVRDGSGSGSGVSRGDTLHRLRRCGDFFGSGIMMIGNGIMGMWKEGERDRREYGRDHERRCRDCDGDSRCERRDKRDYEKHKLGKCECNYGLLIHSLMLDATKKTKTRTRTYDPSIYMSIYSVPFSALRLSPIVIFSSSLYAGGASVYGGSDLEWQGILCPLLETSAITKRVGAVVYNNERDDPFTPLSNAD